MIDWTIDLNPSYVALLAGLRDRARYRRHKSAANHRGIAFELTFDQWLGWWKATGHYSERGKARGQYVMARRGDRGAYRLGNILCVTIEANTDEANQRRDLPAHMAMMRAARAAKETSRRISNVD